MAWLMIIRKTLRRLAIIVIVVMAVTTLAQAKARPLHCGVCGNRTDAVVQDIHARAIAMAHPRFAEHASVVEGRIHLILEYFARRNTAGQMAAIQANVLNPLVARVVVFVESEDDAKMLSGLALASNKLVTHVMHDTGFNLVLAFETMDNIFSSFNSPAIVILVNSDCHFDVSIANLAFLLTSKEPMAAAISRLATPTPLADAEIERTESPDTWVKKKRNFENWDLCMHTPASHDAFAFTKTPTYNAADGWGELRLGIRKIETAMYALFTTNSLRAVNPCKFVNVFHNHDESSASRRARRGPGYKKVAPPIADIIDKAGPIPEALRPRTARDSFRDYYDW
jgi:hypothetical protein